jgi:AraC-like DNA-binding protein
MYNYYEAKSTFEIEGFYTAIKYDWTEPFVFNGESHDFWEAVFVESGRVDVTEDENFYTLSEGNVIFHAPMEFHRIRSAEGSSPKVFVFSFRTSGELPTAIRAGVFTVNPLQKKLFDALRDSIYDYVNKELSAISGEKAASLLKLFIIEMAKTPVVTDTASPHTALEYQRIISFMSRNIFENLTLEDIASRTNISVSYMKILFKTYAGISPKSYYNLMRVQKATELLNKGDSVTEVSLAMNFASSN